MGLGVKLLVILTHMGPNSTMAQAHSPFVPRKAHLPKIKLLFQWVYQWSPPKGVTFIIVGQTTATYDIRL